MQWQPFFLPYNRQLHLRLSLNQKRDHIISFDEQETSVSLNGAGKPKNILATVLTEQKNPVASLR